MTPDYQTLPDHEAETAIYNNLKCYDAEERVRYAGIGLMVLAVHKRLLWKFRIDPADGMPCRSFARWVRIACPYSYSTVYAALKDVEELADVPSEALLQIPQSNMRTMKQLSTAVRRDPAVLEAAKGRTDSLVAYVNKSYPDQHIAVKKGVKVMVDDPDMVYSVLDQAVELHDAIDRGHALEMICAMARKTWELEGEVEQSLQMEAGRG